MKLQVAPPPSVSSYYDADDGLHPLGLSTTNSDPHKFLMPI